MVYHMMSWEQFYTEHHQGDNWSREKKMDQERILTHPRVIGALRRWLVLLDNSYSSTAKKWLNKKKHLTTDTIKLNLVKKNSCMLYPVKIHWKYQEL